MASIFVRITAQSVTCKVLSVSSVEAGVIAQMIEVLAFPPRDVCRIRVSLESRKGTNVLKEISNKI